MRRLLALLAFTATASAQQPFTLQQVLSAPYALALTAAPTGNHFAWVENAEGRRNIWIAAPNEAARQLTHYTEDDGQDISSLTWSPDATQIAYTYGAESGASGRPANPAHLQRPTTLQILIQPTTGGDPIKLGEGRSPLFTRDGSSILFIRAGQIFITCVNTCHPEHSEGPALPPEAAQLLAGVLSVVTSKSGEHLSQQLIFDRGTASSLTLSPDGKLLAYVSHRRTHTYIALFNFETKTLTFPSPSTGSDYAPIFSPDGKSLAWLRGPFTGAPEFASNRTSPYPWSIQLTNLATNTTRTVFSPEPNQPGSVEPRMSTGVPHLYFTAANKILFFSEADGWVHLYSIDPTKSAPPQLLTPGNFEVEDVTLSPQGSTLVYASNQATPSSIDVDLRHLWKIDLSAPSPTPAQISSGGIQTHPQITREGTIAALVSTERRPMQVRVISPGVPQLLHNFVSATTTYPAEQFVTPQQVIFPSTDDLFQLHAQLFLPKSSTGKKPAILFVHGGPMRQLLLGYPSMDYYSNAYAMNQYLVSRGYIVLSVNYRGGIGYGLNFRQCEHCGADGGAEYADVLAAAAYLRSRPDVDTAHIGIWGGSYGGYLTAQALAHNSDIFAAGVDFHGVHEWSLEDNASADWLRGTLAVQEQLAIVAHESSPMSALDTWHSPILLIHGDDDPEVAYTQTPTLADALRARDVHVEELIFPDEVHDFILHKDWLAAYEATANFFDRTLKPSK